MCSPQSLLLLLLLLALNHIQAKVSILSEVQYLYESSTTLRIRVSNITDVDPKNITLSVGIKYSTPLVSPQDMTLEKDPDGEGLIIQLGPNKR